MMSGANSSRWLAGWRRRGRSQRARRKLAVRRIGVLMHTTADEPDAQAQMAAFLQGLQVAGWEVGRNLRIETRWSGGDPARLRKNAADLVALNPDVIMAGSGPTLPAMLQATRTVPIVFAQSIDPIGSGSVRSLAQPGGNATGFLQFEYDLAGKWLELLKEIAPRGQARGRVSGNRYHGLGRPVGCDSGLLACGRRGAEPSRSAQRSRH